MTDRLHLFQQRIDGRAHTPDQLDRADLLAGSTVTADTYISHRFAFPQGFLRAPDRIAAGKCSAEAMRGL